MASDFAKGRIGTTLRGKYRLDGLLGVGGMAAVYRGVHRNGNRVAVKLLHPELSTIDEVRQRFLKEGYVANAVDHPGAVRVIDDDVTEDGAVFLVMELLEGETLDALWKRSDPKRLRADEVAEYAAQVLGTLAAAHAQGIVHRDIKPENLFLTHAGEVKILDFGIARMRAANAESMTRTGRMMGTPAYMPPEQALGLKDIDGRTDLWALGATMFTLISGSFVHVADTMESMVVFTATRPAPALATVAPYSPVPLMGVVDRALGFAREDRYPDASAMLAALSHAYGLAFGSPLPAPRPRANERPILALTIPPEPRTLPVIGSAPPPPAIPPPMMMSARAVSTTAGMSSEYGRAMLAPSAPAASAANGRRARIAVLVAVGGIAFVAAAGIAVFARSTTAPAAAAEPSASAESVPSAPLTTTPTSPPPSAPSALALESAAASTVASVPAIVDASAPSAPAAPLAAKAASPLRPGGKPTAPPRATPAEPDCNPPIFYDPVTGKKKVKPGC